MKSYFPYLIIVFFFGTIFTEAMSQSLLTTPHFLEARKKAENEQKRLLVHFTASWSNPCSKMFSTTYRNDEVRKILQNEFIFTLIDIDDFDGYVLSQHYNINNLPTLVLFDQNGRVIKRHQGKLTAEELKKFIEAEGDAEESAVAINETKDQPGMMERINNTPGIESTEVVKNQHKIDTNTAAKKQVEEKEEYYAIQLGAFTDKANAEKMLENYSSQSIQDLHLQSELLNERERFLLLGGKFSSREQAEQKLVELRTNGKDGFIKSIKSTNG
ncbi:MAG: DUF255 domain-containing protein [Saprospirales bacterium]|nr:MAG: DUF255 domain-containing protein [Saprospirales bacterium]